MEECRENGARDEEGEEEWKGNEREVVEGKITREGKGGKKGNKEKVEEGKNQEKEEEEWKGNRRKVV